MKRFVLAALALAALAAAPVPRSILKLHSVLRGHPNQPRHCTFSPDGKLLAVCCDAKEIWLWEARNTVRKAIVRVEEASPTRVAFSPDSKTLFCTTERGHRIRWDIAGGTKEDVFHARERGRGTIWRLAISPDGKRLGVCSSRSAMVWDAATDGEITTCTWKLSSRSILSHDLRLVAVMNYQDVDLRDMRTGKITQSLLDHPGSVSRLSFSADDRLLAVSYRWRKDDEDGVSDRLWDVKRGAVVRTINLNLMRTTDIALSPKGDLLAVTGLVDERETLELRVYDTSTGDELGRTRPATPREYVWGVMFSPDGKLLALQCADFKVEPEVRPSVRLYEVHKPMKTR